MVEEAGNRRFCCRDDIGRCRGIGLWLLGFFLFVRSS